MNKILTTVFSLYLLFLGAATTEVAAQDQKVYQFTDI